MYLSNNYVDINIYPLTMNVMRLWACLYGKGAISNDNIIIIIIIIITACQLLKGLHSKKKSMIYTWSLLLQWELETNL